MADKPDWFKIVSDYQPRWTRGPTIPFIFGAMRPLDAAPPDRRQGQVELLALLKRMEIEASPLFGVCLRPCNNAGHVVIAEGVGLAWDPYDFTEIATIDALSARLWNLYGDQISAGNYSIDNFEWHPYWPDQILEIERILGLGQTEKGPL